MDPLGLSLTLARRSHPNRCISLGRPRRPRRGWTTPMAGAAARVLRCRMRLTEVRNKRRGSGHQALRIREGGVLGSTAKQSLPSSRFRLHLLAASRGIRLVGRPQLRVEYLAGFPTWAGFSTECFPTEYTHSMSDGGFPHFGSQRRLLRCTGVPDKMCSSGKEGVAASSTFGGDRGAAPTLWNSLHRNSYLPLD